MRIRGTGAALPAQPPPPKAAGKPPGAPPDAGAVSDFQAPRSAPLSLGSGAPRAFSQPAKGEWTIDQGTGQRSDPITLYVHGSLPQIEHALTATGWTQADPKSLGADIRYAGAALEQEASKALSYVAKGIDGAEVGLAGAFGLKLHPWLKTEPVQVPGVQRMPVSVQSYRGQKLIAAYERNNDPLGGRDHLRLFDTGQRDGQGQEVYAVAASRDTGIRFAPDHPECAFLFHDVQPNVDSERDAALQSLKQGAPGTTASAFGLPFGGPSKIGEYVGDGQAYQVELGGKPIA